MSWLEEKQVCNAIIEKIQQGQVMSSALKQTIAKDHNLEEWEVMDALHELMSRGRVVVNSEWKLAVRKELPAPPEPPIELAAEPDPMQTRFVSDEPLEEKNEDSIGR